MEHLLAKLSEQQALLEKQTSAIAPENDLEIRYTKQNSSLNLVPLTPESDAFANVPSNNQTRMNDGAHTSVAEMTRLKKELDAAKDQIARQKQELDQTRVIKQTFDQVKVSLAEPGMNLRVDTSGALHNALNPSHRSAGHRQDNWNYNDDARSDFSDGASTSILNSAQNIWASPVRAPYNTGLASSVNQQFQQPVSTWAPSAGRPWSHRGVGTTLPPLTTTNQHMQQRALSGPVSPVSSNDGRAFNDFNHFQAGGLRRSNTQNVRNPSIFTQPRSSGWDIYGNGVGALDGVNMAVNTNPAFQSMGLYPASMQYQPRPIGTPLSPTAEEFKAAPPSNNPWNVAVGFSPIILMSSTNFVPEPFISGTNLRFANGASQLSTLA